MGRITITRAQSKFSVTEDISFISNGNNYCYDVFAEPGDSIEITVSGNASSPYYVLDDTTKGNVVGTTIVTFNNSLRVCFYVASSTITGVFNEATINIENTTTSQDYDTFNKTVVNERDNNNVISTNTLSSYNEPSFNIVAGVAYVISTGLTTVKDISIYDSGGADITATLSLSISGGDVTINSTNNLTGVTAQIIGEA